MGEDQVDAIVIGAGVVGCAIAQRLAERGIRPVVIDANSMVGEGVTSRNSGVIHAGLYYPPNSLKASTCVEGKDRLKHWCRKHDVPWKETGKWIVAQESERAGLEETMENALASGATGITWKSSAEIANSLPGVKASCAIFSSETGIVDPYGFTRSLMNDAMQNGADEVLSAKVLGVETKADAYVVRTSRGSISSSRVFNCAGLFADEIALMVGVTKYRIFPWRGDYFRINRRMGFDTLVYPAKQKNAPGLGIHLTVALDGSCRLGPDVELVTMKDDFSSREDKLVKFLEAASRYIPDLRLEDLVYDTCGLRPKLRGPDDSIEKDFVVSEDLPGFVNLVGIESPGLTAAMALAIRAIG